MAESVSQSLTQIMENFLEQNGGLEAAAIVTTDGLVIANAQRVSIDLDVMAAIPSSVLSFGKKVARELMGGSLDQVYIKGESGYVVIFDAGEDLLLTALVNKRANLGLVFLDMKRMIHSIIGVI
jgi:predicted regulator of Ras-like GTPase activity (Roadblock/LC7/MglB family)